MKGASPSPSAISSSSDATVGSRSARSANTASGAYSPRGRDAYSISSMRARCSGSVIEKRSTRSEHPTPTSVSATRTTLSSLARSAEVRLTAAMKNTEYIVTYAA